MPSPTLQFKRGLFANLPGLKAGEPGFTTDSYELYVGIDSTTNNNKFFGSHRYWTKETASTGSGVNLVEGTNNGAHFITLASPASVGAAVTYYFPASPIATNILTTDANGVLSWTAALDTLSINNLIVGIGTFNKNVAFTSTTNNTLGDENTGAVQLDGGMGIAENLTVKQNLHVGGYAEFVGVVTATTFNGQINAGVSTISVDSSTNALRITQLGSGNALVVEDETNPDSTPFVVNSLGNVGIGTNTVAAHKLQVHDSFLHITNSTEGSGTIKGFLIGYSSSSDTQIINSYSKPISLSTINNIPILLQPGGTNRNVGIGTTTPNNKLDVIGSAYISDNLGIGTTNPTSKLTVSGGVYVTGVSTFSTDLVVTGDLQVNGGDVTSSTASLNLFNTNVTTANVLGAGTTISIGATTGITTVRNNLTVGGDLRINGNDIQASDGNANITLTSNTLTAFVGDIKVGGNDIQASDGNNNITLTSNTLTAFAGDIKIGGNDIQASDGTTAITLSATTGNVGIASNLTITGNLFVNGSTTEVNTETLKVEDSLIEIGLINSGGTLVAPTSDLNKDIGVIFHYFNSVARKAGIYWDDSEGRVAIGSTLSETTSVITATAYAALEIGSLFVTDCAGTSQVISCTGTERFLENITVDCGSF